MQRGARVPSHEQIGLFACFARGVVLPLSLALGSHFGPKAVNGAGSRDTAEKCHRFQQSRSRTAIAEPSTRSLSKNRRATAVNDSSRTISSMFAKPLLKNLVSLNTRHTLRPRALLRLNMQPQAVYSTSTLQDAGAPTFRSMQGKLNNSILKALDGMQYEYMTPVQSKVLSTLPSLRSDW